MGRWWRRKLVGGVELSPGLEEPNPAASCDPSLLGKGGELNPGVTAEPKEPNPGGTADPKELNPGVTAEPKEPNPGVTADPSLLGKGGEKVNYGFTNDCDGGY